MCFVGSRDIIPLAEQSISLKTRRKTEVRIILGWHTGQSYRKIYGTILNGNDPVDDDAEALFSNVFSNKILGVINNESENSFIEKLVVEAQKKKVVSHVAESTRSIPTKKVLFIGKNSVFTKAIVSGISKVFSENGSFELKCDYVEPSSHIPQNIQFRQKLSDAINSYAGVIIRPIGVMNENVFSEFQKLCESTTVILCDIDIMQEQRRRLGVNAPVYVCSDFMKGGEKMGRFSGVAIGIYRYAATIFALRQVILLTQLYFAFSKVLFLSSREVKANII